MKVNMINRKEVSKDSYVRDLPNAFVYYMDDEPHSVWQSVDVGMEHSALSLHGVRSFISFFVNEYSQPNKPDVIIFDKIMTVDEVFNFNHDGVKIVAVDDVEIAELNVKF